MTGKKVITNFLNPLNIYRLHVTLFPNILKKKKLTSHSKCISCSKIKSVQKEKRKPFTHKRKKNRYSYHPYIFKWLILICICYLLKFKYFNYFYFKKKKVNVTTTLISIHTIIKTIIFSTIKKTLYWKFIHSLLKKNKIK